MDQLELALAAFGKILSVGYFFGFNSTFWNKETSSFLFNDSKIRKIISRGHLVLGNLYLAFLGFRIVLLSNNGRINIEERLHLVYIFISLSIINIICIEGTYRNYDYLHTIINSNVKFTKGFYAVHRQMELVGQMRWKAARLIFRIILFTITFALMGTGLRSYKSPRGLILLSSLFETPESFGVCMRFGFAFSQAYFIGFAAYNLTFHFANAFLWVILLEQVVLGLRELCTKHFSVVEHCRLYRTLGVAQRRLVGVYGTILLCVVLAGNIIVIWYLVQAFLFHRPRGFVVGLGTLITFTKFQISCSRLHEESTELLLKWANLSGDPYFVKFRKGSKSIRVPIGTFFYFDRALVLTTGSLVLESCVNLLVLLQGSH